MSEESAATTGAMLEIDTLQLGAMGTNCYIVRELGSREAVVVDPGDEHERILELLDERELTVAGILVTHCHYDHIGAVAALAAATGADVWMSESEALALEHPEQFVFPGMPVIAPWRVDHRLTGHEHINVAGIHFDVLSLPGHSPGHLGFLTHGTPDASGDGWEMPPVCFVGDVIFRGSVGRTDLPFADGPTLKRSLKQLLERLDPDTVLLSGHGQPTELRHEAATNRFLRGI